MFSKEKGQGKGGRYDLLQRASKYKSLPIRLKDTCSSFICFWKRRLFCCRSQIVYPLSVLAFRGE